MTSKEAHVAHREHKMTGIRAPYRRRGRTIGPTLTLLVVVLLLVVTIIIKKRIDRNRIPVYVEDRPLGREPLVTFLPNSAGSRIIIPTYVDHFDYLVDFFKTATCFVEDKIPYSIIVSDDKEAALLTKRLGNVIADCATYHLPRGKVPMLRDYEIINLYDLLPPALKAMCQPNDTSKLLKKYGKFKYQSLKKLLAAYQLDYKHALWLDSEAQIIQPLNWQRFFQSYFAKPVIWRSRMLGDVDVPFSHKIMHASAAVLGLSLEYFGTQYWNLESFKWMIEKEIIVDLIESVADLHQRSFWDVFLEQDGEPFEVCVYYLFIHLRKMETQSPLYAKYTFLQTEREMARYGLRMLLVAFSTLFTGTEKARTESAMHWIRSMACGRIERIFLLLQDGRNVAGLSRFLKDNELDMQRLDDVEFAPKTNIKQWLLQANIKIIVSSSPDLKQLEHV